MGWAGLGLGLGRGWAELGWWLAGRFVVGHPGRADLLKPETEVGLLEKKKVVSDPQKGCRTTNSSKQFLFISFLRA